MISYSKNIRVCGTLDRPRITNFATGMIIDTGPDSIYQLKDLSNREFIQDCLHRGILVNRGGSPVFLEEYGSLDRLDDVHIDITNRCNTNCSFCYQSSPDNQDLPLDLAKSVILQARKLGAARIALSGGEPFLHPHFNEIVNAVIDEKLILTAVFTNALDLPREINLPQHTCLLISYSPAVSRVINLDTIRTVASDRNVVVSTVTVDGQELDRLYDEFSKLGIWRWRIGVIRPVGGGKNAVVDMPRVIGAYKKLFYKFMKDYDENRAPFELQIGFAFQSTFLERGYIDLYPSGSACCMYKNESMCVKWNGDVTPCSLDFTKIGTCTDLHSAWSKIVEKSYRSIQSGDIDGCRDCELLSLCNGGCRACVEDPLVDVDKISCYTYRFLADIIPELEKRGVESRI